MKRPLYIILIITTFCLIAFRAALIDPAEQLSTALYKWNANNPQEKIYLHTDKPYYELGDTIWFKAYVTLGASNKPSVRSGAVYVDLINEKDSLEKSIKLAVAKGFASGFLVLSDDIAEGGYKLRSYTQWMRNSSDDYYFDKTFRVTNPYLNEVKAVANFEYESINNIPMVTAKIRFTDIDGKAFANKTIRYNVVVDFDRTIRKVSKTDTDGTLQVSLPVNSKVDLNHTYLETITQAKGNDNIVKSFAIPTALSKTDLQFFPEGGSMITGIKSKIAFKAIGVNGKGLAVKGEIVDNLGKSITTISSEFAGMGSFQLTPEVNKTYQAVVNLPDGTKMKADLPKPNNAGCVLSVLQENKDDVFVRIQGANLTDQNYILMVNTGGEPIFSTSFEIVDGIANISIKRSSFPTGIAQFTVFDTKLRPLNERLAFIRADNGMPIKMSSEKEIYKTREAINIAIQAPIGNYSVSVVQENKVPTDENEEHSIFSSLLLSSSLRGYIEQPNHYFTGSVTEHERELDNLMLTQGYTRFNWEDVIAEKNGAITYKVEKTMVDVSGTVKTLGNQPVPNARVAMFSLNSALMELTKSDAQGKFVFPGMMLDEGMRFNVQAKTPKNGGKVQVILDLVKPQGMTLNKNRPDLNGYQTYSLKSNKSLYTGNRLDRSKRLREVRIEARRSQSRKISPQSVFKIADGQSDQTYIMKDGEECATLGTCLQGRLGPVTFLQFNGVANYPFYRNLPMDVFLDGSHITDPAMLSEIFDTNVYDPSNVAKIEVVRSNLAAMSVLNRNPALMIMTKRIDDREERYTPNVANYFPQGLAKARSFYSPKYEKANDDGQFDFRSTIYWNPSLKVDETGLLNFIFYNSDGTGTYRVTVEGIDNEGHLGRAIYRYKVE